MSAVHRISGLEGNHLLPAKLVKVKSKLRRGIFSKLVFGDRGRKVCLTSQSDVIVVFEAVDGVNLSSNVEFLGSLVQIFNSRMFVVSAKNFFGLLLPIDHQFLTASAILWKDLLVRLVYIFDGDNGEITIITEVAENDTSTWLNP